MERIAVARGAGSALMRPVAIRFGRLGDMLLLAPLLARLHRDYGAPCLLLGTGPWSAALYENHPDVAEVVQVVDRHRPLPLNPERWRMLRVLCTARAAPVYVCEAEPRALAKIRRMLRWARVDPAHCAFITEQPVWPDEHWIDRLLRFAATPPPAFAASPRAPTADDTNCAAPRLYLSDADRRDRDAWLHARGWYGRPLILVQPANKRTLRGHSVRAGDDKAWPASHWIDLLRALHARQPEAQILLCGAPAEAPLLDDIARRAGLPRVAVGARELPLRRLMALAGIACGMVSVDTGPAHVAAAMGCPLVVLFGAQSPRVWLPRSPAGSAVIALGGPPARERVAQIAPAEVIEAWQRVITVAGACSGG